MHINHNKTKNDLRTWYRWRWCEDIREKKVDVLIFSVNFILGLFLYCSYKVCSYKKTNV